MTFNFELFNRLVEREDDELSRLQESQLEAYRHQQQLVGMKQHLKDNTLLDAAQSRVSAIGRDISEIRKRLEQLWLIRELATTEEDPTK